MIWIYKSLTTYLHYHMLHTRLIAMPITGIGAGGYVEDVTCKDAVKTNREKVCSIMEVLARDHMKVVFFGR